MLAKLKEIEERFVKLEERLSDSEIFNDQELMRKLLKEQKNLSPLIEAYRLYLRAENDFEGARELLNESHDPEMKEMARVEMDDARERMDDLTERLKMLLIPRDPNDDKSVIVEIRGGAGGDEAALFAGVLYRMYSMYAVTKGFKTDIMNANETQLGGYKEICFEISGEGAYSRFKFESGVHRVQRVPDTESSGRIHTSTVTVAVLPEADEVEIDVNPDDLNIDTYRSSGAGGQHVNKTESAIRITHIPTGLVVECQDERSQHKNKERAMKILASRLLDLKQREQNARIAADRKSQVGTGDRSERIRTYNYSQGRVSDHRIGVTFHRLEAILNGDLDELIDALIVADHANKLRASDTGRD